MEANHRGKTPEDIVRWPVPGILYKPYTMIVMESTTKWYRKLFCIGNMKQHQTHISLTI